MTCNFSCKPMSRLSQFEMDDFRNSPSSNRISNFSHKNGCWPVATVFKNIRMYPYDAYFPDRLIVSLSAEVDLQVPEWLTYDFPPEVKARLTNLWGTEWNGQAQKWLVETLGNFSHFSTALICSNSWSKLICKS